MTVTVSQVRIAINIPDKGDLNDDVFELNLIRAQTKVDAMAKSTASEALKDDAILSLAVFYTYRTYADRINHNPEGTWNPETGQWEPTMGVRVRETTAKLESLRKDAQESLNMIKFRTVSIV